MPSQWAQRLGNMKRNEVFPWVVHREVVGLGEDGTPIEPSRPRFSDGLLIYDAQLSRLFRFPHAQHPLTFGSTAVWLGIGG